MSNEIQRMEADLMFKEKNMIVSFLLWFFLGFFGAHRFFLGKTKSAIGMIVLFLLGLVSAGILMPVLWIWWAIDGYFTYKYTNDHNDKMTLKKMEYFKKIEEENKEEVKEEVKEEA
tara:strand:- start:31366 stop:31713 length:348 start_codon:yes stop_codon:yes gene_type:complete